MKKKIIAVLGVLLMFIITWMGYTSIEKLVKRQTTSEMQGNLTEMLNQLGQADLHIEPSTILIFFNSECEHCQWEIEEISKKIIEFNQHQLLLTSFEPEQEAIAFLNQHGLSNHYIKSTPSKVMRSEEHTSQIHSQ